MVIGERRSFARGCGAPLFKSALEESASVWQRTGEVPNEQSLSIQSEGFHNLQRAITERASDQEILKIIQRLIHLFGESQRGIGRGIEDLEQQAHDLLSRRS